MRAGDDPEPADEGGDPACWAHLFEGDEPAAGPDGELPGEDRPDD